MIRAILFDLDGTLVETEHLKALSYAKAATELCPNCASEDAIMSAFKDVVGRSRQEVAQSLMERFGLTEAASQRMQQYGATAPWQAYVDLRLEIYNKMFADPQTIRDSRCPYAIDLLYEVREEGYETALTTTSTRKATQYVLQTLGLQNEFDFISTADDVEHTKPDPEVYCCVLSHLKLSGDECLAIEDSLAGVKAALAAGVRCVAATTSFTREAVHNAKILDKTRIVDDDTQLSAVVHHVIQQYEQQKAA